MPRKKSSEEWAQDLSPLEELSLEERFLRLDARDQHPDLYHAAQDRARALERDALEREAAREAWARDGGDPKTFDTEWKTISTEAKRQRVAQEQEQARNSAWRRELEKF